MELTNFSESTMKDGTSYRGKAATISKCVSRLVAASITLCAARVAAQQEGFDFPFDHPLQFNAPIVGTHDTVYGSDALQWTAATRVLAVQGIGKNWDMIVDTSDGPTYVSQNQGVGDVDFVLFDGTTLQGDLRAVPATTATVYHNGDAGGLFYAYYVKATPFDRWDGENGYADFEMLYYDLVQAKTLYLKAGTAYRFDIDRGSKGQSGFASLMRTDPNTRIQPRSQAAAEFWWDGDRHDDFVYVPEEGLYTLVVVQKNGDAVALATVHNSQVIPRGEGRVDDNSVRINVSAE